MQRHLFAKELEKMQEHIQLTGDSLVLEEVQHRGIEDQCQALPSGLRLAPLELLLPKLSQAGPWYHGGPIPKGRRQRLGGTATGKRFSAQLLTEKLYYIAGTVSAEQAEQNGQTYACRTLVLGEPKWAPHRKGLWFFDNRQGYRHLSEKVRPVRL
eukprot:Skav222792  [mRNA]  locus=scaffold1419:54225:55650:+ [translate_table: standard]